MPLYLLLPFIVNIFTLDIFILPLGHVIAGLPWPHGKEVCHHGAEPGGEAGLGNEAELELRQADHVITLLPVPAGDVQQIRLKCNCTFYNLWKNWFGCGRPCCGTAWAGWWSCSRRSSSSWKWPSWCSPRPPRQGLHNTGDRCQYQSPKIWNLKFLKLIHKSL